MTSLRKEISTFAAACEPLLADAIKIKDLNEEEAQVIQYYLSALAQKFPALSN